jgi:predicted nucleic acid-binding Zn ribbon protein
MSFGGSVSGMLVSLKNNKRTRVSTFEKMKNFREGKNIQVSFDKKATSHQLKNIREKLQKENKTRLKRNLIIFSIIILLLIYVIGFVKI